jgi:hypothetical protein
VRKLTQKRKRNEKKKEFTVEKIRKELKDAEKYFGSFDCIKDFHFSWNDF